MRLQRVGHDLTSHTHTHTLPGVLNVARDTFQKKKKKKILESKIISQRAPRREIMMYFEGTQES